MRLRLAGILVLLSPAVTAVLIGGTKAGAAIVALHLTGAVALIVLDAAFGVRRDAVQVSRNVARRVSVGQVVPVTLRLRNALRRSLLVRMRDGVPQSLRPERFMSCVRVAAGAEEEVSYNIAPNRRGAYEIDGVWIQLPGLLGMVYRTFERRLMSQVAVIPDIRPLRIYDMQATRSLAASAGIRRQRTPGEGGEVERLREYQTGDDPRLIDWKATARRYSLISREMEAERNRNIVFLVDAGRWMGQPVDHLLKIDHALNAVLMASHVADRHGDITSVQVFSDRVLVYHPPGRGKNHQLRLLESLHRVPVDPVEPDFDQAFRFHHLRFKKRALAILFSDFSDPVTAESLQRSLSVLSRRHLLLCVHILDPAVDDLVGLRTDSLGELARRAVAESLHRERKITLDRLRCGGAHILECPANRLTAKLVDRYLEIKSRGLL